MFLACRAPKLAFRKVPDFCTVVDGSMSTCFAPYSLQGNLGDIGDDTHRKAFHSWFVKYSLQVAVFAGAVRKG